MGPMLLSLLLGVAGPETPAETKPVATYQTVKKLDALEKCLTDKLSEIGEVVAVNIEEDSKTLVVRQERKQPMIIDLSPPSVTVTTKFMHGTRMMVESCL
jgi:tricorn protease-like protein